MFVIWTDNLSVGLKEFDEDHKRLVRILNELYSAVHCGDVKHSPDELEIALERLEMFTKSHFGREELLMTKTGFPGVEAHKREHQKFAAMVAEMAERFRGSTDPQHAQELVEALYTWVTHHIFEDDKQYSVHIHDPKVKRRYADIIEDFSGSGPFLLPPVKAAR